MSASVREGPGDPLLASLLAEQEYLARARAELERMRQHTLSLSVAGGSPLSSEYLAMALWQRAESLVDDPSTTLFFGRTDHAAESADSADPAGSSGSTWYIGRRHVADDAGDPVVLDWRADVARAFYRASRREPMGVLRRRRFGVEQGQITAFEDEHLADPAESDGNSAILAHEIERPRAGPMRDIVATIQPEQDVIVRAGLETSVCIQGAPGTGKTAVGLHRAAWLLYTHRARLDRAGVLVVGPTQAFLEHVNAVLPSLGEAQVRHATVELLVTSDADGKPVNQVRSADPVEVAMLKGDIRMAQVLSRAVWSSISTPAEALVVPRGIQRWRVPAHRVAEIVDELKSRGVRYLAAREMLAQRLAHAVLVKMEDAGDSPDDRVQDSVARSRDVKKYIDTVWPAADPKTVVWQLFSDPSRLTAAAAGILTTDEQQTLLWTSPARTAGAAKWSPADTVLLDEVADILRRPTSLGHVILDEAQDLSPMQLRAVGRRVTAGSMTVLGDIAQGTTPWATAGWEQTMAHLGQPDAELDVLDRGFRVPAAVISYAAQLLPVIAPGLSTPTSVRDNPGSLRFVTSASETALWKDVLDVVALDLTELGSIGVIVPDRWLAQAQATLAAMPDRVTVLGATTAKGLEFDRVVVVEPSLIAADEPDERTGLRRLYVVLTRAVTALSVVHHAPLPALLVPPPPG